MTTHITMRAAQARCYECGAPEVLQVCHHCGQAICRAHRRLPFELQRWLLHSEFDGLGLPETLARIAPAHCRDCDHVVYAPRVLVLAIGAALAITGAALLARRFSFAALVLLGLGLALAAAYALNWRWRANPRNRPPLPLFPRIGVIKIRETVAATVTLDERGDYHIAQQPATGELEVVASLQASERERLAHYRKWLHLPPNQSVAFHAGFLALRGKAALQLTGANRADLVAPNIIALMGETGALPLLNSASARASDTFPCKYTYQVYDPPKPMPLPINLVPSFIPEAGAQALDLELQWINPRQWSDPLAIERIALLRVDVPVAWGTVKSIEGGDALLCSLDNGFQRIEWSLPPIAEDQAQRKSWRFSLGS